MDKETFVRATLNIISDNFYGIPAFIEGGNARIFFMTGAGIEDNVNVFQQVSFQMEHDGLPEVNPYYNPDGDFGDIFFDNSSPEGERSQAAWDGAVIAWNVLHPEDIIPL